MGGAPGPWAPAPSAAPPAWTGPLGGAGAARAAGHAAARSPSWGRSRRLQAALGPRPRPRGPAPPPPHPSSSCRGQDRENAPWGGGEEEAVEEAAAEVLQSELVSQQGQAAREQVQENVPERQVAEGPHCKHSRRPPAAPASLARPEPEPTQAGRQVPGASGGPGPNREGPRVRWGGDKILSLGFRPAAKGTGVKWAPADTQCRGRPPHATRHS